MSLKIPQKEWVLGSVAVGMGEWMIEVAVGGEVIVEVAVEEISLLATSRTYHRGKRKYYSLNWGSWIRFYFSSHLSHSFLSIADIIDLGVIRNLFYTNRELALQAYGTGHQANKQLFIFFILFTYFLLYLLLLL